MQQAAKLPQLSWLSLHRREWGLAFTDDPELLRLISVSTLTLGPYIVFDGLQTVLSVRLAAPTRCLHDTRCQSRLWVWCPA